ncbi:hypothetical protein ONZ45_g14752 [Pleurotus djamor]|nr:hypothetical protein ONZ45_g14752 [Pleurotus djamor]
MGNYSSVLLALLRSALSSRLPLLLPSNPAILNTTKTKASRRKSQNRSTLRENHQHQRSNQPFEHNCSKLLVEESDGFVISARSMMFNVPSRREDVRVVVVGRVSRVYMTGPDHLTMQTADANGHLTNLNDAQRKGKDFLLPILSNPHNATFSAVHHPPHIPLQILAGPGSGKTRVLTSRIAHLILHHAIPSASICAVTFTNKAANEMKERLTKLLGAEQTRTLKLGTFHALCASFLRKYASLVGLSNNFSVCDADESKKIISRLLKPYKTFLDAKDITLKEGTVLSMISKHKYKGFTATEVLSELRTPPSVVSEKENITAQSKSKTRSTEIDHVVAEVYREYEKALRKSNSLDFDDLLLFGLELFKHHKKSLIWCKHVLVDEFQDTNSIQYELMKTIANSASECLTVVGDPDQSIYGWRSADVTNLAKMRKDFAQTESVLLEENYRSTASILKASLAIVAQAFIASEIKRLTAQMGGVLTWKDFAILLRFNALSRAIESALQRVGIPCRILGGHRFFERAEIKDLLAYLQLVDNPHFSPAFIRAINVPARGIGEKVCLSTKVIYAR